MRTVGQCHEGRCLGIEGDVEGPLPNVFAPPPPPLLVLMHGCGWDVTFHAFDLDSSQRRGV